MGNFMNRVTGEPIATKTFEQAAAKIKLATTLTELCLALNSFQALVKISGEWRFEYIAFGIDFAELPTFGGPAVETYDDVFSWDAAEWIVSDASGAFMIEDRADLS